VTFTRRDIVAASTVALAGCGLVPEGSDPVEASASAPATLRAAGYAEIASEETTVETTIRVDLTGDVELNGSRDVVATVFRRVYEADAGDRFGLVTAPRVRVFDSPEIIRDPVGSLEAARMLELVTGLPVESVGSVGESGSATMLGTDTTLSTATAATGDGDTPAVWTRVRAGEDSVTAVATGGGDPPFGGVTRDA
jgi:hypothetical protein